MAELPSRDAQVARFVRKQFGLLGTLQLHRKAFGADLLRAPINVALAPIILLTRLTALIANLCRLPRLGSWCAARRIILPTRIGQEVETNVLGLIAELEQQDLLRPAPKAATLQAVTDYTSIRTAVAEITTTCLVILLGYAIFRTATPGIISMAGPVAEMQAHQRAVEHFWAGQNLGRLYYGVFATQLTTAQVIVTGVALAMLASLVTTFAGIIADPLQVATGTHKRRLLRLLHRLDTAPDKQSMLATEHIAARSADLTDIVLNIWRALRG